MLSYFSFIRSEIGIDLGTANVLVYIKNKGVVLNEPSVVAIDDKTGNVLAVGKEAKLMLGRNPKNISVIKPLRDGVISDFNITVKMLRHFIHETCGKRRFFRPSIMVCVPGGVTLVEKKAVVDATYDAGGAKIHLIDEPTAAAIGAGIDIGAPDGHMVVDIGGGTTDIAVISLGGIVASESIKIAGETFNDAIQRHIKKEFGILIGASTAEEIKINIGTVLKDDEPVFMDCRGRQILSGLPENVVISSNSLVSCLEDPMMIMVNAIKHVFEKTPPEIAGDIYNNGIVLTGGGALLRGIDRVVSHFTGVPCYIAENATECVAIGTGMYLDLYNRELKNLNLESANEFKI